MKKGFYTIMSAQFFSSLADNALLVAAIEMLKTTNAPSWNIPALGPMFALFYVILAPFLGAFADAVPKGKVMFLSNGIKVVFSRRVCYSFQLWPAKDFSAGIRGRVHEDCASAWRDGGL